MDQQTSLNPYASLLGEQHPVPVLATTASRLKTLTSAMSPQQLQAPRAPGKWSPREILAHLADCELVFSFRLRQTLAGAASGIAPILQPFDQDIWAERYAACDLPASLSLFTAVRTWNLALLTTLTPEEHHLPANHPERGTMTFQTILETMAGHDLNHLQQLEAIPVA